jgi:hypothetical protein
MQRQPRRGESTSQFALYSIDSPIEYAQKCKICLKRARDEVSDFGTPGYDRQVPGRSRHSDCSARLLISRPRRQNTLAPESKKPQQPMSQLQCRKLEPVEATDMDAKVGASFDVQRNQSSRTLRI